MNKLAKTDLWQKIVRDFRRVCILRGQNRMDAAAPILSMLTEYIQQWSETTPGTANDKRMQLTQMFAEQQDRVEDTLAMCDVLSTSLIDDIRHTVSREIYRRIPSSHSLNARSSFPSAFQHDSRIEPRIPFDDVNGAIDVLFTNRAVSGSEMAVAI